MDDAKRQLVRTWLIKARNDLKTARGIGANFKNYEESAITLTPYATAYRYPGESSALEPSRPEFEEALKLADEFLTFVCSLLPEEVQSDSAK